MTDTHLGIVITAKDQATAAVKGIQAGFAGFKKDALTGFGLGAGISVFNLAEQGVRMVGDAIGEVVKAAEEAQAADARLDTALKANVTSWNENKTAIDGVIQSREQLGFTDTEQKDALTALVAHTKDVTTALEAEAVAMDLSRFKQIDLATAAQAVGKGFDGTTTALKKMGIQVDKGAKGMDVLNAIEKTAGGQAVAFSKTLAGREAGLSAAVDHLKESLGALVIGPATDFLGWVTQLITGAPKAHDALQTFTDAMVAQTQAIKDQQAALAGGPGGKEDPLGYDRMAKALADFGGHILPQIKAADEFALANRSLGTALGYSADRLAQLYKDEGPNAQNALILLTMGFTGVGSAAATTSPMMDGLTNRFQHMYPVINALADISNIAVHRMTHDFSSLSGVVKGSLHDAKQAAEKGMADLQWALTHPLAGQKLENFYHRELTQAYKKLHQAQDAGNLVAVAKAQQLIADLQTTLAQMDTASFSLSASLYYSSAQPMGQGTVSPTTHPHGGGHPHPHHQQGPRIGGPLPGHYPQGFGGDIYLDGAKVGRVMDQRQGRQLQYVGPGSRG